MPATLLRSQFEALEPPEPGAHTLALPMERPPDELVEGIRRWLTS